MMRGDFVTAAHMLGLEPGQSVVLKTMYQELTTKLVSLDRNAQLSPIEAGRIAGRRICMYGLIPGAAKVAGEAVKALGPRGNSMFKPIKSADITPNAENLANKWIETDKGPAKLGDLLSPKGKSLFGAVYRDGENPGQVIKISKPPAPKIENPAETFPRQKEGADLLQEHGIPTPKIKGLQEGGIGKPAILWIEDAYKKWPGGKPAPPNLTDVHIDAARELYKQIADAGMVWADGHADNMFFFPKRGGGLAAGVLDADMIVTDLAAAPEAVANRLWKSLMRMEKGDLLIGNDPHAIMNTLFDARFGANRLSPNISK
jgi:hypothetical protein